MDQPFFKTLEPFLNDIDRIDDIYAFIATDAAGNEGLPAFVADGVAYPLVAADVKRLHCLYPMAKHIADESGQTLRLYRFRGRELLDTISPAAEEPAP